MDSRKSDQQLIECILEDYAKVPYSHGDFHLQPIFDREQNHYLLMLVGWEGIRRVHGCLVHVDIIDGKFWIQRDGTERGIARELIDAGVSKDNIVLAFRSPEMRELSEFAIA
jgi:XisI protein